MSSIIKVRRSYTAATPPVSGKLADGQLGVNLADKTIFVGGPSGTIVQLVAPPVLATLTGDVTGTETSSGAIAVTLASSGVTAGTYTKVTVDAKGRVTVGTQLAASDINTALGYTAYNGATNPNGYLTANQAITVVGDATGSGTTSLTLTLSASGVAAGTYTQVTVDAKGRVTTGVNPTTLAGYGISNAVATNVASTVSTPITMTSGATVTGIPTPTNASDAASKNYVDTTVTSAINGVNWKKEVKAVATNNVALTGLQTIDGYVGVAGDRVLVASETDQTTDGIYVIGSGAWTRTSDAATGSQIWGLAVLVLNGTVNALTQWVNTNQSTPTVGTDNITFGRLTQSGQTYLASTGLTLTGTTFSITNTGVTAGTYTKVTVNAQGQVTTATSLAASDVNTALGYTAYNGTTNSSGFINSIVVTGDATGTATINNGAASLPLTLASTGVTAGTYTKVTVDAKGRVTTGAALAASDVTTALGYTPFNRAGDTLTGLLNWAPPVTLASAATVNIGAAGSNAIIISGSTTITAFDTIAAGAERYLQFTGTPTLTYNATSLILPGLANINAQVGDSASFVSLGGGNWKCMYYTRANGTALVTTPYSVTQVFNGSVTQIAAKFTNAIELVSIVAAAPIATQTFYPASGAVQFYTVAATANWAINFAFSASVPLNTVMNVGESLTLAMLTTQGTTAFFANAFQIDGTTITPKWQGGSAPSAGNASGIDAYTFTIIKTAASTYTVLAAATQYK